MRTLASWKQQEQRLRDLHTQQGRTGQWKSAQTTQDKHIQVLNNIHDLEHPADARIPRPPAHDDWMGQAKRLREPAWS